MTSIFDGFPTDKGGRDGSHSYEPTYRGLFENSVTQLRRIGRFDVKAVLELGIYLGGSLRAWKKYFPRAEIVGLDNDNGTMIHGEERITTFLGDVRSEEALRTVARLHDYNLIVDDASHRPIDQFHALKHLWGSVVPGGFYVIEDLDMNRNGSEILTTCTLIVRGEAEISLHLGDKRADDLLILEKT